MHDSDAMLASPRSDGPIRGRAGMSYAAALLLDPEQPPTMRGVAREVHMSPQAISNAAKLLADQGLVVDGRPALPDLFWALAEVWRPVTVAPVAAAPDPASTQLAYHLDDLGQPGWAAAGDRAALELGAPVFTTDDRPWFWVPTRTEARRAQRTLGTADPETKHATVAVPPTPLVVTRRVPPTPGSAPWPLAHSGLHRTRARPRPGPGPRDPRAVAPGRVRPCLGLNRRPSSPSPTRSRRCSTRSSPSLPRTSPRSRSSAASR